MTEGTSGFFTKVNTARILRVIVIIAAIIPLLRPIGIPTPIDPHDTMFYEIVESLESGDIVVINWETSPAKYEAVAYGSAVTIKRLMEKGVKFVVYTFSETGSATLATLLTESPMSIEQFPNLEYGTDMIYVGFIAGEETGLALITQNPWSRGKDYFGNDLSELPLTKEVTSFEDFKLIFTFGTTGTVQNALFRQWISPYGTPSIGIYPGSEAGSMFLWYPDWIQAVVSDTMGEAALEKLFGTPYKATSILDAASAVALSLLFIIIGANIHYWTIERRAQ